MTVTLRPVVDADLEHFFAHQRDPEARAMAAFVCKDPEDRGAFDAHWRKIRGLESVLISTIEVEGEVAGNIASFHRGEEREVTYWIGRAYWGRGVATCALELFLATEPTRPIFGRVAKDHLASGRVLEKCGFRFAREDRGYAEARGEEIDERVFRLA